MLARSIRPLFYLTRARTVMRSTNLALSSDTGKKSTPEDAVKFSTSRAKTWDPINTFSHDKKREQPVYQPFIIIFSVTVFMVYFLLLREENELDEYISRPLEQAVPNIKVMTLKHQIAQYESMGLDSRELKLALEREIKKSK